MAKNDIQELEQDIKQIEKEYSGLMAKVSRASQHMSTYDFMRLKDHSRRELIRSEIDLYCERDNKVRDKQKQITDIRQAHKGDNNG